MGKFKNIFVSVVVILIAVFHNSYEPTKITFLEFLASLRDQQTESDIDVIGVQVYS